MTENFTKSGVKNYDKAYSVRSESLRNPRDSAKDDLIANFILSNISSGKEINILDIGCGMGQTILKLINTLSDRRKVKLAGIDMSKIGLLKARNKIKNHSYFGHFVFGIISIIGMKMEKLLQSKTNAKNSSKFVELINKILRVIVWSVIFEYEWLKKPRGAGLFIVAIATKDKEEAIGV